MEAEPPPPVLPPLKPPQNASTDYFASSQIRNLDNYAQKIQHLIVESFEQCKEFDFKLSMVITQYAADLS